MDTDVSHEVEKRLSALEDFVGINKEEEESSEPKDGEEEESSEEDEEVEE